MNFFQGLGKFATNIFDFLKNSDIQNIIQAFTGLFGITVTIWIMLEVYKSYAGKSESPIKELIWKIVSSMLVISVASNNGGFLDMLKIAFEEMHNIMGGEVNLFANLDKLFDETIKFANSLYKASPSGFWGAIVGGLSMAIVYAGFLAPAIPVFLAIVFSELTLKILLLLLPLAIFSLAFNFSKRIWTQWLNMFISNALTLFIIGTLMNAIINSYINWQMEISKGTSGNIDILGVALMSFISGAIIFALVKVAKDIAEKLGEVSMDSLGQSASKEAYDKTKSDYGSGVKGATTGMKGLRAGTKYLASKGRPSGQAFSGDAV